MRRTIVAAMDAVAGRPPRRVFVAEWLDPPFAAGHWVPEMVDLAGGDDVLGGPGGRQLRDHLGRGCRRSGRS